MTRLCNNCTHDVFAFGVVHYIKRGINVMGPSTTRSSSPSHVDGRLTERSADCSTAFPARATPVRPHELSSRHVSRRHDTLAVSTTYCRLTYCTSSWPFNCLPRVWHQSVRVSRRHETSPSPRSIDIWPTIVQPTTTSTSLRSNVFCCRWDYVTAQQTHNIFITFDKGYIHVITKTFFNNIS